MSAFEIKIVAPEIAAALNNLADALRGQGQLALTTGTAEIVQAKTEKTATTRKAKTEEKPKQASTEAEVAKTETAAGGADDAEASKPSSTSQSEKQASEDDDLTGTDEPITVEVLGKAITDAVAAGHRAEVVAILAEYGAKKGSAVAEEDRTACFERVNVLLEG